MENTINSTSLYFADLANDSEETNETLISLAQFPFWRETLAVWIITSVFSHLNVVAIDLALLVTMLKTKKLRRPINYIHMSILVSQMMSRLLFFFAFLFILLQLGKTVLARFYQFFIECTLIVVSVYEPVAFAFLSCLQLLTIKSKKIFGKVAAASICFSLAYSAVFAIEYIVLERKTKLRANDNNMFQRLCSS